MVGGGGTSSGCRNPETTSAVGADGADPVLFVQLDDHGDGSQAPPPCPPPPRIPGLRFNGAHLERGEAEPTWGVATSGAAVWTVISV